MVHAAGRDRVRPARPALIVGVAALIVSAVLILAVSGGHDDGSSAAESPGPRTPQEACVVTVMDLMAQSRQAVQQGYQNGLDLNDLAVRYGTESAVWRAFAHSQALLVLDVYSHGADGPLTRIQPTVRQQCGEPG